MNEYFIRQRRYNTAKTVKSRTVSTGQKGSKATAVKYTLMKKHTALKQNIKKRTDQNLRGPHAAICYGPAPDLSSKPAGRCGW